MCVAFAWLVMKAFHSDDAVLFILFANRSFANSFWSTELSVFSMYTVYEYVIWFHSRVGCENRACFVSCPEVIKGVQNQGVDCFVSQGSFATVKNVWGCLWIWFTSPVPVQLLKVQINWTVEFPFYMPTPWKKLPANTHDNSLSLNMSSEVEVVFSDTVNDETLSSTTEAFLVICGATCKGSDLFI